MANIISLDALKSINESPIVSEIMSKVNSTKATLNDFYNINQQTINNYSMIAQMITNGQETHIDILPDAKLCINNNFTLIDKNSYWNDRAVQFSFFAQPFLESKEMRFVQSFLATITYKDTLSKLNSVLTDSGIEIFSKLESLYKDSKLPPFENSRAIYKINNLNKSEIDFFSFATPDATIYIKEARRTYLYFIGNFRPEKDTPFPTFKYRAFDSDINDYSFIPEKAFMINHSDDINYALDMFNKYEVSKIKAHIDFLNRSNKLIERYLVLAKI